MMGDNHSFTSAMRKSPSIERIEALAFRRQQIAFCVLTLFVIAILLLLHTLFAPLLGEPSLSVILILGFAFSIKILEIIWLQSKRDGISEEMTRHETVISSLGIFILAGVLAFLTNRDELAAIVKRLLPDDPEIQKL